MAEELSHHVLQLRSLDASCACAFRHEMSDAVEPVQCPMRVKELRLCCAHAARSILYDAIAALENAGRLSDVEAGTFRGRIWEASIELARLDIAAAGEYGMRMETQAGSIEVLGPAHDLVTGQKQTVASLDALRKELLDLCA